MPGYVVLGDDGVFRLGRDDASSVDEERTKRVVSAVPGAPGQVYGGTQVGNVCEAQVAGHVRSPWQTCDTTAAGTAWWLSPRTPADCPASCSAAVAPEAAFTVRRYGDTTPA